MWFFKGSLVAWGPIIKFAYLYKNIFCNKNRRKYVVYKGILELTGVLKHFVLG